MKQNLKLGDICRFEYGTNLPSRDRIPGPVSVYGSNGVVGSHSSAITKGSTIIIGRKGSIGEIHLSDKACWPIDTTYFIDETCTTCDLVWLAQQLRHLNLDSLNKASGVPGLNREDAYKLEVIVPSIKQQYRIASHIKAQLVAVEEARSAVHIQLEEIVNLANAIIRQSVEDSDTATTKLGDVLDEVKKGIGKMWAKYPVLGATRVGLALAKEPVGKIPERYKPVMCGTVFYNPMRIMIGSIAMVDEYDTPGITSPDYVALQGKPGLVDSRWFYYWLRSPYGVSCIASLARGAVRERMLFNRLAEGNIELPPYDVQVTASKALAELKPIQTAIKKQLNEIDLVPAKILSNAFEA